MRLNTAIDWRRVASLTILGVGIAGAAVVSVMPELPALRTRLVLVLWAILLVVLGVALNRPRRHRPWWLLVLALSFSAAGDAIVLRASGAHTVSVNVPADAWLTTVAGLLLLAAMFEVTRAVRGTDHGSTLDALVLALAAGTLMWHLGVVAAGVPGWERGGTEVAGFLQVLFVVAVLGLLVRTARVIPAARRSAALLLVAAVIATLTAFLLGALRETAEGVAHYAGTRAGAGTLANLAAAAAAMHPSMSTLTERWTAPPDDLTPTRTVALGLAMLTPGMILLWSTWRNAPQSPLTLGAAWCVLVPTVLARIQLLVRSRDAARRLASTTEQRMTSLIAHTGDVLLLVRPDHVGVLRIEYASPSSAQVLGRSPSGLVAEPATTLAAADDRDRLTELLGASEPLPRTADLRAAHADATTRWVETVVDAYPDDRPGLVVTLRDITERKQAELHWEQAAVSDHLTGLLNRRGVEQHLEEALAARAVDGPRVAVLMVDLDDFKAINDRYGHPAGDQVLRQIGARLRETTRRGDVGARLGGDEFLLVCHDVHEPDDLRALAARVILALGEPILIADEARTIRASVGVAMASDDDSLSRLLRRADVALYRSKATGGGRATLAQLDGGLTPAARPVRGSREPLTADVRRHP